MKLERLGLTQVGYQRQLFTGTAGVPPRNAPPGAKFSNPSENLFALRAHCGRDARGPSKWDDRFIASLAFIQVRLRGGADSLADQLKRKTLAQQVIEKALGLGASLRPATQADALLERTVEQFCFGSLGVDLVERFISNRAINFLLRQTQFQSPASYRLLPNFRRRITKRIAFVVQIAILTQARDHSFDNSLAGTTLRQPLAEFLNRTRL